MGMGAEGPSTFKSIQGEGWGVLSLSGNHPTSQGVRTNPETLMIPTLRLKWARVHAGDSEGRVHAQLGFKLQLLSLLVADTDPGKDSVQIGTEPPRGRRSRGGGSDGSRGRAGAQLTGSRATSQPRW